MCVRAHLKNIYKRYTHNYTAGDKIKWGGALICWDWENVFVSMHFEPIGCLSVLHSDTAFILYVAWLCFNMSVKTGFLRVAEEFTSQAAIHGSDDKIR